MTEVAVSLIPRYCGLACWPSVCQSRAPASPCWCDTVAIPEPVPMPMVEIGLGRMSMEQDGYMKNVHLPTQCLHLVWFCQSALVQGEQSHYCSRQSRACAAAAAAHGGLVSLGHLHGLHARRKDVDTDGWIWSAATKWDVSTATSLKAPSRHGLG